MRVRHPVAEADEGTVDAAVDVDGELVPVEDGTFEVENRAWLNRWADNYGYEPEDLIVGEAEETNDEDEGVAPATCGDLGESTSDDCGRDPGWGRESDDGPCADHVEE